MSPTLPAGAAPGYPSLGVLLEAATEEFRATVLQLGQRLPLPGRADMLAGKRISPHGYATLLLVALRQAGLGRIEAERWLLFNGALIEQLWATDCTPFDALERREQEAEDAGNLAHLLWHQSRHTSDLTLRDRAKAALREARIREVSCELAVLAHPESR